MIVVGILWVFFMGLFYRECWLDQKRFERQQLLDYERLIADFDRFIKEQRENEIVVQNE